MKHFKIMLFLIAAGCFSLAGCYEEDNPNDGHFVTLGDVPLISDMVPSTTTPTAGSVIDMTLRVSFVNTSIKEFRLYQRIGTSGAYTLLKSEPFVPNFDVAQRVHVIKLPYNVPNEVGRSFSLQVEAVTDADLVSSRRTMSPTNVTIR